MRHVRHATVRLLRGGFVFVRVGVGLRVGQYRRRLRLLGHRQCFRGHLDGGRLRFPETYGSFEDLGKRRAREQGDRWSRENPNRSTVIARHRRFCCDKKSHTMHAYPANAGQATVRKCFGCGSPDHVRRDCPNPSEGDNTCRQCGKTGHQRSECPDTKCYNCNKDGHIAANCPAPRNRTTHGTENKHRNHNGNSRLNHFATRSLASTPSYSARTRTGSCLQTPTLAATWLSSSTIAGRVRRH